MSNILVQNIKHTNGTTAATIDTAGVFSSAGHVIQAVTNRDTTATNITSSGTFVDITSSEVTITAKKANSSYLYFATLSAEPDLPAGTNLENYIRFVYTLNGGSTVQHNVTKLIYAQGGHDDMGFASTTPIYLFDGISTSKGDVLKFFIQYRQDRTNSYQFNQDGLTNQPSSTDIMSSVTVQEIAT